MMPSRSVLKSTNATHGSGSAVATVASHGLRTAGGISGDREKIAIRAEDNDARKFFMKNYHLLLKNDHYRSLVLIQLQTDKWTGRIINR